MARIEIYINGKLADYDKVDLSFVYSVEDDDSLSVSGSHSKRSIKIPATKRNNDIFQNALKLNLPQNLNGGLLQLPSRIIVDGMPLFIGSAQVDKATITKYSKQYEVIFLADNSDWIEQMRDVGMDTIVMPGDEIQYTASNVMGGYLANGPGSGFAFFLPKVAKWQKVKQVQVDELYPSIFIEWIFRQAFTNIGYTINSNFFQTDFFRRLIVPVLSRNYDTKWYKENSLLQMTNAQPSFVGYPYCDVFFGTISSNINFQTEYINAGTPGLHRYRPRVNGKYKFTGSFTGNYFTGTAPFYIKIPRISQNLIPVDKPYEVELTIGDVISILMPIVNTGTPTVLTSNFKVEYVSQLQDTKVPNITIGSYGNFNAYYNLSVLAKEWKILNIFSDIQKLFNLVFVTDANKKEVTIEPRDYWIASNRTGTPSNGNGLYTENLDVTNRLDISKEVSVEFNPDVERYLVYEYKDDDPTVKAFEAEREGLRLYSFKYDRGPRFRNEEKEVKLNFFNKCMHIEDSEIWGANFNKLRRFQLPLLFSENQLKTPNPDFPDYSNQTPYLLYYFGSFVIPSYGETSMPIEYYDKLTNWTWNQFPVVPLAFMNYYNDYAIPAITNNTANLSFSKEDKTHGLITDFHQRDLERKAQNVKMEVYLNWSNIDIFNLDFKRKYIIDEVPYILKTVDGYNPATGSTTKTVFAIDSRLMKDDDNQTNTQSIDSDLKGLIVI